MVAFLVGDIMVDIFKEYVDNFDLEDERVLQKYNHSLRVMELSSKYASILGFSKEDIYLAKVIGLLHDFGRFEQLKRLDSYSDSKIDHAKLGVELLFKENYIEKFNIDKKYYSLIEKVILNHNLLELPSITGERESRLSKLLRDVDKIDIMYSLGVLNELSFMKGDNSDISEVIINHIKNYERVSKIEMETKNDIVAIKFGLIYDMNYNDCLQEFFNNLVSYYNLLIDKDKFKILLDYNMKYMKERGI